MAIKLSVNGKATEIHDGIFFTNQNYKNSFCHHGVMMLINLKAYKKLNLDMSFEMGLN